MKILITGANGSLGTDLLSKLKDNKIVALALDQDDAHNLKKIESVEIIYGNICSLSDSFLQKHLSDIDIFIHLAALVHQPSAPKDQYYKVNYEATKRLSEAFNKYSTSPIKQFLFISTVAVYGNYQSQPYNEKSNCLPDTPYGESKLLAENHLRESFTKSSLRCTILRPTTIYGGQNDKGNITKLVKIISKWHIFPLFNQGKTLKSFVYIGDVAQAIVNCLNNKAAFGQTYNISAPALSLKEIMKRLANKLGIIMFTIPVPLFILTTLNPKSKLCQDNSYTFNKAQQEINYQPNTFPAGL